MRLPFVSHLGSLSRRWSMAWFVPPTLLPGKASTTNDWQSGSVWPTEQYFVAAVPSIILDWYSVLPPPAPSKSRAPYQPPMALAPEPSLTVQFAPEIGLLFESRQAESPIMIAHGIRLLVPRSERICAAAAAETGSVLKPSAPPKIQSNCFSSST